MNAYVADAGAFCMAGLMRTQFPVICPAMMSKVIARHAGDLDTDGTAYVPGMCQCVQRRIDALSPADLRPYMQALMASSNHDHPADDIAMQTLPPKFVADVRECGMAAANRMVDAEIAAASAATAIAPAAPASAP